MSTPCSDSLMRGFAALNPQYDPWAQNVMTRALSARIGRTLADPHAERCPAAPAQPACTLSCVDVRCGNDGCDGDCTSDCTCEGGANDECLDGIGAGVCRDAVSCARSIDIPGGVLNDPNDDLDCSAAYRADDRFIHATCTGNHRWRQLDCTLYTTIEDCLGTLPPPAM